MNEARPLERPLSLKAYRWATGVASPLARPLLKSRARRGKEDPARLGERLGIASAPRPQQPLVWMHGASVGESVSLLALVERLRAERDDLAILITSGTRASAQILAGRLPPGVIHQYAPIDAPGAVARFLGHWRPDVGLFAESELWPNLILGARAAGTRLALVSARMTQRSARGWAARPSAAAAMLDCFEMVLPQDAATAERLGRLGARIEGRLNLKRAGAALGCDPNELARLRAAIGARRVVVAVSTHESEEQLIAAAVAGLSAAPLLVIAPRHPERADVIARQLAPRTLARRSAGEPIAPDTDVYLADTLGELGLFLRLAQFAVIGGGFAPRVGGHNPLEAARLGVGVVTGPHVSNHAEAFEEMIQAGAAVVARDGPELTAVLARLLDTPDEAQRLAAAAQAFAARQGAEFEAAMQRLRPLLPAR
jgi:3-deoxy-D-manno-octulosonic-acid transferase